MVTEFWVTGRKRKMKNCGRSYPSGHASTTRWVSIAGERRNPKDPFAEGLRGGKCRRGKSEDIRRKEGESGSRRPRRRPLTPPGEIMERLPMPRHPLSI